MKEYIFKLTDKVRDYECDLQGVVNNSNYQHYMEHTRHEFLESLGENFGAMHDKGIDAFVARVDIQFKNSLRSGDRYTSCLNVYKKGYRSIDYHNAKRTPYKLIKNFLIYDPISQNKLTNYSAWQEGKKE